MIRPDMIKIKRFRWVGLVACVGEEEYLQGFCGKPEGRRPFGRPTCRWKDNIKIYIKGIL